MPGGGRIGQEVERRLRAWAKQDVAKHAARFFRTEPGGYGEGDAFLGVRVPMLRRLARELRAHEVADIADLMDSKWHEIRLLAVIVLAEQYARGSDARREEIYRRYVAHLDRVNNWDLVDSSAPHVVGRHLLHRDRAILWRLARSTNVWRRRIAILATQHFIRHGETTETFRLAEQLVHDHADLIHKAVGWMLREAGQREPQALRVFLDQHAATMPRTMLRYALEKVSAAERKHYMKARGLSGRARAIRA
jgi:3-methyladenine DNA glycosylase AlkD